MRKLSLKKIPTPIIYLLELLVVVLVFVLAQQYQKRDLIDGQLPTFSAETVEGMVFDSNDMRGKSYILHFWASWCPICRFEQDAIQELSGDYPLIGVAMQSGDREKVSAYMREHKLTFTTLLDEQGQLAQQFGVKGVPTTLLINSQGEVAFSEIGYTSEWGLRLRMWLVN
ncbi:MAG: protein disulfide oxidoreductase [Thiohalophilus sp.]